MQRSWSSFRISCCWQLNLSVAGRGPRVSYFPFPSSVRVSSPAVSFGRRSNQPPPSSYITFMPVIFHAHQNVPTNDALFRTQFGESRARDLAEQMRAKWAKSTRQNVVPLPGRSIDLQNLISLRIPRRRRRVELGSSKDSAVHEFLTCRVLPACPRWSRLGRRIDM